jgi:hypothetical protein
VQRQARLTKRERRELEATPLDRQRPRTLTRMTTPPLPEGWIKCAGCRKALQLAALIKLQMLEPELTVDRSDQLIKNPKAGQVALAGHLCPSCNLPNWAPALGG